MTSTIPQRIRLLLDADPFTPFSVHLSDHHSILIGDPAAARIEDRGRTLIVRTLVRRDEYLETVDMAAITRLLVKVPPMVAETPVTEDSIEVQPAQGEPLRITRVLFICTRNSVRSQMAEAWLRHLGGDQMHAESAGFDPGELHPLAVEVMREVGIDISGQTTKSIFEVYRTGAMFGFTISVCDESAEKSPIFPGTTERLHWNIPDPVAGGEGSEADLLARMRAARDTLREHVETWVGQMADSR